MTDDDRLFLLGFADAARFIARRRAFFLSDENAYLSCVQALRHAEHDQRILTRPRALRVRLNGFILGLREALHVVAS